MTSNRHAGESGHPEAFDFPGFRVALAIASLPGMTIELCNDLWLHDNSVTCQNFVAQREMFRQICACWV